MIQRDYVIIGAGVAAACVCEGIRAYDKRGSVTVIGNENYPPYHRPPLSKSFLKRSETPAERLFHHDAQWFHKHKIDLRLNTVVTEFNIDRRLAVLDHGQTLEFKKACLATGSRPRRPPVAGTTLGNVLYLRTIRDALALREILPTEKTIVVIGGGFIGAETSAMLVSTGHKVALMDRDQSIWQQLLDPQTAAWLTDYFRSHGVTLMMQESLNGFEGKTVLKNIQTKSGNRFPAGMALVAVGADPNLDLVRNTPLSSPNGTPVTEYLETEEKGIYAVGDIALFPDSTFGGVRRVEHFTNATKQGLLAGANMTGRKRQKFDEIPTFWSELFDLKFEFVGDFRRPPSRIEVTGVREKKHFTVKYFQGEKVVAAVLCNRPEEDVEMLKQAIIKANRVG